MIGLSFLMELFHAINEDHIDCWNHICGAANGNCTKSDERSILAAHERLTKVNERVSHLYRGYDYLNLDSDDEIADARIKQVPGDILNIMGTHCLTSQFVDILVTQKWLQNRVWRIAYNHNLLATRSRCPELSYVYAINLAESALEICRSVSLSAMESHGIGLVCTLQRMCRLHWLAIF